jgi:hypothetical protein
VNICQVYDVIFNTNVTQKADNDPYVFGLMIQLTFERIKQKYSHELSSNFVKMKNMKYKGKTTRPQRVRVRTGPKIEEIIKEPTDNFSNKNISRDVSNEVNEKGKTPNWGLLVLKSSNVDSQLFAKLNETATGIMDKRLTAEDYELNRNSDVIYYDGYNANPKTGEALLLVIELNLLSRPNAVNLNVSDEGLVLNCGKIYNLELAFPFKINSNEVYSFFETTKRLLYLVLPFHKEDLEVGVSDKTKGQIKISDDYLYDVVL